MKRKYKRLILTLRKYGFQLVQIIIGTALMAMGVSQFLLPNQLSSGGFSGIATITYYLFDWQMGIVILLLNLPLFLLAYFRIGRGFFIRAIIGTILLSFFIDIFDQFSSLTQDKFLACIYGGIVTGLGTALVLKVSASTGGSDLLSYIIRSYKKGVSTSRLIVMLDTIIIALNVIFFKNLEIGLYSAISIYIMGKILDIVFEGVYFSKMIFIVSDKYEEISNEIEQSLKRGCTGFYSKGMYTDTEKTTLLCIVSRNEVIKIREIANKIDPKNFMVVSNAREVYGKGFKSRSA